MSRDNILHKVRTALGRSAGQAVADVPPVRLRDARSRHGRPHRADAARASRRWPGMTARVPRMDAAREFVAAAIAGKTAVASNAPYLAECGIASLPGVRSGIRDVSELREVCASVDIGITSADYALGDTGTLVMYREPGGGAPGVAAAARAPGGRARASAFSRGWTSCSRFCRDPAEQTSSMVLITGPSRTADIEQILVRGVHGPGQITVVIVG